jgi:hypothetical protein
MSTQWGDPDITTPILIDGEVFNVTVNLWQALNHLENEASIPHTLWVDAICINQQDNVEKSTQMQLMKDIYSQADLVLAWLGPSGEYGEFVLEKIERVGLQMIRIASAMESEEEDDAKVIKRINKEAKKLLTGSTNDDSDIPFHLMGHIFNRTFWERIWIVQEIYFAQCIVLMCGAKLCAWQAFVVACTVFQDKQLKALQLALPAQELGILPPGLFLVQTRATSGSSITNRTLQQLILEGVSEGIYLRELVSSDPRDMIYALLNLSSNSETLGIFPDYSKTCKSLFIQIATVFLTEGHVELLSHCQFPKAQHGLPSWTPDWSMKSEATPLPLDVRASRGSRVSGTSKTLVTVGSSDESIPELSITGVLVGKIYKKGIMTSPTPAGYPKIQEFEEFMHELDDLAHVRRELFGETVEDKDIWRIPIANMEGYEDYNLGECAIREPTPPMYDSYRAIRGHQAPPNGCLDEKEWRLDAGRMYFENSMHIFRRTPFLTDNGYLGMGPKYLKDGDLVVIFCGAHIPNIIREVGAGRYELVGDAYVQGIMNGEFMESEPKTQTFILR